MAKQKEPQAEAEIKEEILEFRGADLQKVLSPVILDAFDKCPGEQGSIVITLNKRVGPDSAFAPILHVGVSMSSKGQGIIIRKDCVSRGIGEAIVDAIGAKKGEWRE